MASSTNVGRVGSVWMLLFALNWPPSLVSAVPAKLSSGEEYHRYIDPLLEVNDFRTHYYEDGAADATVLFPEGTQPPYGYLKPAEPVLVLVQLRERGLALLIDCLSDGRVTKMRFDGNRITQPMNVPVGYVCLDILMGEVSGRPVSDPDCSDDGLGSCMNRGFYFRPDDYFGCTERDCFLRPWVSIVQRKWKAEYLAHHLRSHNPYNTVPVEEYRQFRTTNK
jgi:hypothetical protein